MIPRIDEGYFWPHRWMSEVVRPESVARARSSTRALAIRGRAGRGHGPSQPQRRSLGRPGFASG